MSAIVRALLDELEPDDLAHLAQRLAPYLVPASAPANDGWMTSVEAAAYLAISVNALHRLTATRQVPFSQAGPGAKCYFRRADLDAWRSVRP